MDAEPKPFFSYDREQQYSSLLVPAWVPQSLLQSLLPVLHRASHGPADTGPKRVTLRRSCERSDPGLGRGVCIELLQQRDQVGRPVFHVLPFDFKNELHDEAKIVGSFLASLVHGALVDHLQGGF